jgi:hypothetical protein
LHHADGDHDEELPIPECGHNQKPPIQNKVNKKPQITQSSSYLKFFNNLKFPVIREQKYPLEKKKALIS